ncbi:beta strand repeat-containing protein [Chryseobacterium piscium]|nr:hypothetical protein [Chryseobacterium piscium]
MIKKTTLWRFLVCPILLLSVSSLNLLSAQTGPNDDFDGDGVINSIDIDDDNDGVPDAVESPSCYYTANEWNTLAKPAVGVSIASDLTTVSGLGNFTALGDNNNTVSAVQFVTTPAQTQNNQALFTMTFTLPVQLDAFYIKKSSTTQISGGNLMFEASNDAVTWTPLFSAASNPADATNITANGNVSLTNSNKFAVGINAGKYKYYRIRGTAANNILAGIATEFYFDFNVAKYVASFYPKATCTDANIDGDGILPHFDLDSDGDGCSDAFESGATTNMSANYQFPDIDTNNDGLVDAVDPDGDGIVNYTSTYYSYAINKNISACLDTDGDGIRDVIDIDDDNDGVLDIAEMGRACGEAIVPITSSIVVSPIGGWGSPNNTIDNSGMIGTGLSAVTTGRTTAGVDAFYFKEPSTTATITYNLSQNATLDNVVLWAPESFNHGVGDGPLKDFTVTLTYNGGLTYTSNVFTTVRPTAIDGPIYAQIFNLGQTFSNVSAIRLNILSGWADQTTNSGSGAVLDNNWVSTDGNVMDATYNLTLGEFRYGCSLQDIDTDGDGIPNRLDLDSDGDTCPDALESGVSANSGASASMSASGGSIYTGGVASGTANAYVGNGTPSQYGANGYFNGIETSSESGVYNAVSTYAQYGLSLTVNACADTDGDGILDLVDIDDDNDGILDIIEETCTTPTTSDKTNVIVTKPTTINFNFAAGKILYNLVDGADGTNYVIGNPSGTLTNSEWFRVEFSLPRILTYWEIGHYSGQTLFTGSTTYKVQGSNDAITWTDVTGTLSYTNNQTGLSTQANSNIAQFPNNRTAYKFYRYYGLATVTASNGNATEFYFKEISCTDLDTDNDGIPNRLDLDSDGDTCPDAKESGVSLTSGASGSMSTSGGSIYTGGIASGTANAYVGNGTPSQYGTNGFFNGIETAVDNGTYNSSYTYQYANNNVLNACVDTDGDGVGDLIDIDDDNDGVLDTLEQNCPNGSKTGTIVTKPATINYTFSGAQTLANLVDGTDSNTLVNISPTGTLNNAEWFRVEFPYARILSSWEVAHFSGQTLFSTTSTYKVQGSNDASVWTDLTGTLTYSRTQNGQSTQANNSNVADFSSNLTAYKYYRYFGISGSTGGGWATEFYFKDGACLDIDTDGDLIPNRLDLDSDGDGCPDALEAGVSVNAGAFTSMSASGGGIYTGGIPSGTANAYVGNGTPAQYGSNGFFNGIETAVDNGIYNGSYTYSLYALSLGQNVCTDTDGDNVPDVFDLDDDNDGVLDKVECPTLFTNMATGGGFSTDAAALPNWYTATASATLPIAEPFTPTVITFSNPMGVANYGIGGGNQVNSQLTGGLFDSLDGENTATGVQYVLQEGDPIHPVINKLSNALFVGVPYNYSFDLGNRASGSATKYIVMLYNADTKMAEKIITSGALNTIPAVGATPSYKNFTGSFIPAASANYYLLFYPSVSGNTESDFVIDRVAVAGAGAGACDIDNDGIPNYLDLDSDGDGCPDTKEAILYNHATEASIAGDVKNGSGGVVTSTVNTPNAMVPGPYGNNGFADALQSASNPDAYKYVYTYLFVATDANVSTCDNKFLYDIDSDDDGIPDAVESPSCFYTEAQAMDITEGVTSDFGWTIANPLSKTYDDITLATNYGEISAPTATSIQNKALITFDLPVIDAAFINSITLNVGLSFGAGKWKLQGLNMMTNVWTDLSAAAGQALSAGTIVFNNTLQNNTRYHSYRIIGVDNINIANAARLIEFSIQYKNYNASYHRTKMGCSSDADGDGVPNYIDRDSDGDGCPDAVEAGIPLSKLVPGDFFNTGGTVSGAHVTVGGNYGDNGLGDDVETAPDSGIVNYTSTYTQYATNKTLNFCTDTDGDSVPDLIDLDDDNDGILDTTECTYPALPTTTSTADIFAIWSNTTTAAGTNGAPTYLTSVGSWTSGAGLTAAISGGVINISNVNGSTLGDAFGANEYLEHPFTTTADNYNSLYYIRSSASNATNYHWAMLISDDNFVTYTILNIDMLRNATGVAINDINDYQLKPSTAYKVRTYYWGAPAFTFDEFTMFGYSECDTDNDGVPNRLDLDSDGDGCTDAIEAGTAAQAGTGNTSAGTVVNTSGTQTGVANAIVGNNTPAAYGANGFYNGIENNDTAAATYLGTYTYASAINAVISSCFCYRPAVTAGTILDTPQGITSLQRAGADNDNWPMVRKGAWTALESKTKGFVPNRLTAQQITDIPAANLVEGMMVYNTSLNCLYINTDGTPTGWKCFNTQACPN